MKKLLALASATICCLGNPAMAAIESTPNLMTDTTKHLLMVESATTVSNSIGAQKPAYLIVRCEGNKKDVYISNPTYNGLTFRSDPTISIRWNQNPPMTRRWGDNSSGNAFFANNFSRFTQELVDNDSLIFGWSPYGKTDVAVKFDLKAHSADLARINQLCK